MKEKKLFLEIALFFDGRRFCKKTFYRLVLKKFLILRRFYLVAL